MWWEICSTIGIAIKNRQPYCFPLMINHDHKERFNSDEDIDLYKHFTHQLPLLNLRIKYQQYNVPWGYHDVRVPLGNWNIMGHLQSPKYFEHCMNTVRHYMHMVGEEPNDFIAIHWRAGDYTPGADSYHPRLEAPYYKEAMKHFPGEKFMVFSDDIPGAKELLGSADNLYFAENQNYIEDFRIMKGCKGYICANSSYSALAAVLSDRPEKKMVFPRLWFGRAAAISARDIYPHGAIIL